VRFKQVIKNKSNKKMSGVAVFQGPEVFGTVYFRETKRLNEYFLGLLAKNCGYKSYEEIRQLIKKQDGRDMYMDANSALEFGIVDAVGVPKIRANTMYEVSLVQEKPKLNRQEKKTKRGKKTPKQKS
jgi:hypothetical protein